MGLPGSCKTTFSQDLVKRLMLQNTVKWFNADAVRREYDDWDFSPEGRLRQVQRMRDMADNSSADYAICDFVCPTDEYRSVFDADVVVWMDTIQAGRFEDTNKIFKNPEKFTHRICNWEENEVFLNLLVKELSDTKDSNLRSILKAVSWRTLGTIDTFVLSWIITGQIQLAAAIGGIEVFTKIALYYIHERLWQRIKIK